MKFHLHLLGAVAAICSLSLAQPMRAATTDGEDFKAWKVQVMKRLDQLEKAHDQDQKTIDQNQKTHEQDQQEIQKLKQQLDQTQKTATDAQQKAEAASQVQPVHPIPEGPA